MSRLFSAVVVTLVCDLSALACSCWAQAESAEKKEAAAAPEGWENITENVLSQITNYQDNNWWYNRRVVGVHVDSTNGDLYVMLPQHWGTYKSVDRGESFTLADQKTANGRQVGTCGPYSNPRTGDFLLFKVHAGQNISNEPVVPQSAIVLEHGKTWLPVKNLGDGFRAGMADWSQVPPKHLLAIQHHYHGPSLFFSEDSGQTWGEVPHHGGYGAVLADAKSIIVAMMKEEKGPDGKMTRPPVEGWAAKRALKDIMLTTDRGATYTKVGEFTPVAETATRYGDSLYWLAAEGVMVSRDDGRSWSVMGKPIAQLIGGPLFGEDKSTMVVVTYAAFYKTTNAGEDWEKLTDVWRPDGRSNVKSAWDPISDTLYLGFLGGDVYRFRISRENRAS